MRPALAIAALAAATLLLLAAPLLMLVTSAATTPSTGPGGAPSQAAAPDGIPLHLVALYRAAARAYGVSWLLLASVHAQESDFSRSTAPGVHAGANACGAAGPMQFGVVGVTPYDASPHGGCDAGDAWRTYRDAVTRLPTQEAHDDGPRPAACAPLPRRTSCVYDDLDAIAAAAQYLRDLGAGQSLDNAAWRAARAYNGSAVYADAVLARARRWAAQVTASAAPTAPTDAPDAVAGAIQAADEISTRPYALRHWPTHLDNPSYDCSSATSHVLWGAGVFGTAPWVSGELMHYGEPGPGRWITVYASPDHAFVVVAGRRFDTSRYDTGPNRGQSGPRWRDGPRPLIGFAVRHPPGL